MRRRVRPGRRRLWAKAKGRCSYCGKRIGVLSCTIDHAIPKCKGGTRAGGNARLACKKCNSAKGCMDYHQWIAALPTLINAGYMEMSKEERRRWRRLHPLVLGTTSLVPNCFAEVG